MLRLWLLLVNLVDGEGDSVAEVGGVCGRGEGEVLVLAEGDGNWEGEGGCWAFCERRKRGRERESERGGGKVLMERMVGGLEMGWEVDLKGEERESYMNEGKVEGAEPS